MRLTLIVAPFLLLAGCVALGGVEEVEPGVYRVGVEATTDRAAAEIAEQAARERAEDFCAAQGRRMTDTVSDTDSLSIRTTNGAYSRGENTLTFRCE